jgi:hypothetical protein
LYIAKEFTEINDKSYISTIDFNYSLYCSFKDKTQKIYHTTAFLKAFDYSSTYNLPFFTYFKTRHQDIKNISASIYDSAFWNNAKEFAINVGNEEKARFIESNNFQIPNLPLKTVTDSSSVFEHMYRHWQPKRIQIDNLEPINKNTILNTAEESIFDYNIDAQIFMDIHTTNKKLPHY